MAVYASILLSQVLHSCERGHAQHGDLVRSLLEVRNQTSLEGPLVERLKAVLLHLSHFFSLKSAVVCLKLHSNINDRGKSQNTAWKLECMRTFWLIQGCISLWQTFPLKSIVVCFGALLGGCMAPTCMRVGLYAKFSDGME